MTTVEGELVPRDDQPNVNARRKRKSHADILGRTFKTETYEWDGTTVHSTVLRSFDGADRAIRTRQFAGSTSSTTFQDTTASFDGHGRLHRSHRPEQRDNSDNLKYTTYSYLPDDGIQSVTDGRGAVTNLTYNSRGLLTGKSWTVPSGSGISDPADVTFSYDDLGNRTAMTDGLGTQTYQYDSLSRIISETRQFNSTDTGLPNNAATLNYQYTVSGKLRSYAMPFFQNLQVSYLHDKTARLTGVSGTSASGNHSYATGAVYRAWGALSHIEYGNGVQMNFTGFNNKLQAAGFEVKKNASQIIDKTYQFNADASVKSETDNLNAKFDRAYEYDSQSRMTKALTGAEARGGTDSRYNIPYRAIYQYNAFGQQTQIAYKHYATGDATSNATYQNNRKAGSTYDADGNMLSEAYSPKMYDTDAAGRMHHTFYDFGFEPRVREHEHMGYDGDGMLLKIATSRQENEDPVQNESTYRVRSSVLEGSVVHQAGTASILAGGTRVASHYTVGMGVVGVVWHHKDPSMRSFRSTNASGLIMGSGDSDLDWDSVEADADGKSVGFVDPGLSFPTEPMGDMFEPENPFGSIRGGQFRSYAVDGVMVPESFFISMLEVAFGSQFGLLERSARASRVRGSRYTVGDRRFEWTVRGANAALDEYIEMDGRLPIVQHWLVGGGDQSWAINSSLLSFRYQHERSLWTAPARRLRRGEVNALRRSVEVALGKTELCKKYISDLLNKVAENTGGEVITTDMLELFDMVDQSRGNQEHMGGIWGFMRPHNSSAMNY